MAVITMTTLCVLASLMSMSAAQRRDKKYVTIRSSNTTVQFRIKDFQEFYYCLSRNNQQSCKLECSQKISGKGCSVSNLTKEQSKQDFAYHCQQTSTRDRDNIVCRRQNAVSNTSVNVQSFRINRSTLKCISLTWNSPTVIEYGSSIFESCTNLTHNRSAPTSKPNSDDAISSDHSGVIIFVVVKFIVFVAICVIVGIVGRAQKNSQDGGLVKGLTMRFLNSRGAGDEKRSERGNSPSPGLPLQRTALIPPNYTRPAVTESSPVGTNHICTSPIDSPSSSASLHRTAPISPNNLCIALGQNTTIDFNCNSSGFMDDTSIKSSNRNSAGPNEEVSMSTESTSVASPVSHNIPCPILTSDNSYGNLPNNCTGNEADECPQSPPVSVCESTGGYVELADETSTRQSAEPYDSLRPYTTKRHYSPLCVHSNMDRNANDFALASSFNRDSTDYYTNVKDPPKTDEFGTVDEKYVELSDEPSTALNESSLTGQGSQRTGDGSMGYVDLSDEPLPALVEEDSYSTVQY